MDGSGDRGECCNTWKLIRTVHHHACGQDCNISGLSLRVDSFHDGFVIDAVLGNMLSMVLSSGLAEFWVSWEWPLCQSVMCLVPYSWSAIRR